MSDFVHRDAADGGNAVENSVLVAANTDSTMWVGTSLMSIFNIAKIKNNTKISIVNQPMYSIFFKV